MYIYLGGRFEEGALRGGKSKEAVEVTDCADTAYRLNNARSNKQQPIEKYLERVHRLQCPAREDSVRTHGFESR